MPQMPKFSIWWMYLLILGCLAGIFYMDRNELAKSLDTMEEFEKIVESGGVEKIIIFRNNREAEAVLSKAATEAEFTERERAGAPAAQGKEIGRAHV